MSIFDMGVSLLEFDKINANGNMYTLDGWTTNPCGEIKLNHPVKCISFKKRGRKKMEEEFFYNPNIIYLTNKPPIDEDLIHNFDGVISKVDKVTIKWKISYE